MRKALRLSVAGFFRVMFLLARLPVMVCRDLWNFACQMDQWSQRVLREYAASRNAPHTPCKVIPFRPRHSA